MEWYCDGSTYKNGQAGQDSSYMVCTKDRKYQKRGHLGDYSINYAEIYAIYWSAVLAAKKDKIFSDSQVACKWAKTGLASNEHSTKIASQVKEIIEYKKLKLAQIPRDQNLAGIEIENNPFY